MDLKTCEQNASCDVRIYLVCLVSAKLIDNFLDQINWLVPSLQEFGFSLMFEKFYLKFNFNSNLWLTELGWVSIKKVRSFQYNTGGSEVVIFRGIHGGASLEWKISIPFSNANFW